MIPSCFLLDKYSFWPAREQTSSENNELLISDDITKDSKSLKIWQNCANLTNVQLEKYTNLFFVYQISKTIREKTPRPHD